MDLILSRREMAGVFCLRYAGSIGTCFLHGVEKGAFFATAKHVLNGITIGQCIEFQTLDGWCESKISKVWFAENDIDVCLFILEDFTLSGSGGFHGSAAVPTGGQVFLLVSHTGS